MDISQSKYNNINTDRSGNYFEIMFCSRFQHSAIMYVCGCGRYCIHKNPPTHRVQLIVSYWPFVADMHFQNVYRDSDLCFPVCRISLSWSIIPPTPKWSYGFSVCAMSNSRESHSGFHLHTNAVHPLLGLIHLPPLLNQEQRTKATSDDMALVGA